MLPVLKPHPSISFNDIIRDLIEDSVSLENEPDCITVLKKKIQEKAACTFHELQQGFKIIPMIDYFLKKKRR
jgi:hypothetical protein